MTYAKYLDFWLESYCRVNLKDTTCASYAKRIEFFLKPALGNFELQELTPLIIQNYLNDLFNQGYSRNTLVMLKALLSGSLSYCLCRCGSQQDNHHEEPLCPCPARRGKRGDGSHRQSLFTIPRRMC